MDPRASSELQAEKLVDAIEHALDNNAPAHELIALMQQAYKSQSELNALGPMSQGRRIAVNRILADLSRLHDALALRLSQLWAQTTSPPAISLHQLLGGAGLMPKP